MTEHHPRPAKVRISDKRRRHEAETAAAEGGPDEVEARADHPSGSSEAEARADHPSNSANAETSPEELAPEAEHDYLDDLKRLQAEFDNYRKRMMREQTEIASRAGARLVERLLPVLDNFERAIGHSEDDGMKLVHKELISVLESEGLSGIEALGAPFDPNLHEAVESYDEEGIIEPTVVKVHRTGYEFKGKVLRAAMVAVARPAESAPESTADSEGS
jgi:molecular chaperone GrpE